MSNLNEIKVAAKELALSEIEKFGLPTKIHFEISYEKGIKIAEDLNANVDLVEIGVSLMDLKLGEAFKNKKLAEHVTMSAEASESFLSNYSLDDETKGKILNCVKAHHGKTPFSCVEAEITANADCYRFIHPKAVIHYIGTLSKRELPLHEIINQAEAKLDEKWQILSLDSCKNELNQHYESFKNLLKAAMD